MKYLLPLLLGSFFYSAYAMADQPQKLEEKYSKQRATFDSHDHNKDGLVADFEYMKDMKDRFTARDTNKSGTLTRKENFRSLYEQYKESVKDLDEKDQLPASALVVGYEALFSIEDMNGDDIVTEYENMLSYKDLFRRVDENGNGFVTWDEYISFLESDESQSLLELSKKKKANNQVDNSKR